MNKYRLVYGHLWQNYGKSWQVRVSYVLHVITRICKFIGIPVAMSIILARLSVEDYEGAYQGVFLFVGISALIAAFSPLTKYIGMLGENRVYREATAAYFSRLIHADLDYFNSNLTGYLTTATRQYVDSGIQFVRVLRDKYMTTLLSILLPLAAIAWLDPWLGVVAFTLSLVQASYLIWASHVIDPLRTYARELYKRNSGYMADVISNILAVRSSAQEATHANRVRKGAEKESQAFTMRYILQAKLVAGRELITVVFFMILLWLTVQRMSGGHIDIAAAVLVVAYTLTILTGIYSLSDDLDEHDDIIDKIIPAFEILDRTNMITDPKHPKPFKDVRGEITFKNVDFAYESGQPVLKKFSLHISAGQKVGIVGLSGAGKSTLTKLLLQ